MNVVLTLLRDRGRSGGQSPVECRPTHSLNIHYHVCGDIKTVLIVSKWQ